MMVLVPLGRKADDNPIEGVHEPRLDMECRVLLEDTGWAVESPDTKRHERGKEEVRLREIEDICTHEHPKVERHRPPPPFRVAPGSPEKCDKCAHMLREIFPVDIPHILHCRIDFFLWRIFVFLPARSPSNPRRHKRW